MNRLCSYRNRGRSWGDWSRSYSNRSSGGAPPTLAGLGSLLLGRLARLGRFGRRTVSRLSSLFDTLPLFEDSGYVGGSVGMSSGDNQHQGGHYDH